MDENNNIPEGTNPTPEGTSTPTPAPTGAPVETPSAPLTPPVAPEPAQAGYDAQYAVQPTPAAQPTPGAPMPAAPPSPVPALVCGILSIVFCGIIGLILGIIALVQTNKYFKSGGTEGTAKGGKICGIIGIVLSVIVIIGSCVVVAVALNNAQNAVTVSTTSSYSTSSDSSYQAEVDEDDAAVYAAVDPYLEQIKNKDPEMVATIAAIMEESFNDELEDADITLADCGVDAQELALAMMDGFDYEPFYVSQDGAIAEANYEVTIREMYDVGEEFYDQVTSLISEVSAGTMTQEEALQAIGQALMTAVQATEPSSGNYWDVDVSNATGSWLLDSESWDDELDYFFTF